MTHTEQIAVYRYKKADDGFGEYIPATPELLTNAPTYATIQQVSGDDLIISERLASNLQFDVTVNWRDDFSWQRDCFIVSRFGNLDIDGITETKRKRTMQLRCVYIEGIDDTGSGTPAIVGGLRTLYYTVPTDSSSITLPAIADAEVYLAFRDGIEKKVVTSGPQVNEIAINAGVLTLVSGDIFAAGERITILYL